MPVEMCYLEAKQLHLQAHFKNLALISGTWVRACQTCQRSIKIDKPYKSTKIHVMQAKLTLRVEEAVIRQAKLLAKRRGTSVSRIFGDFISAQTEDLPSAEDLDLPPITAAMLGSISNYDLDISEKDYYQHLEDKHL